MKEACIKSGNNIMKAQEQSQQQGFYPQLITIENVTRSPSDYSQKRPRNYKPHQLTNHIPLSKTPIELLQSFTAIPIIETPEDRLNLISRGRPLRGYQQASTPYQRYVKHPQQYNLIYAKYGNITFRKYINGQVERTITLPNILSYEQSQYKPLRQNLLEDLLQRQRKREIEFDSRFQSGNLYCVFQSKKQANFYHCFAESDSNTSGYTQWFYFSLKGTKKDTIYRFLFPNLRKRFSFFKEGMKPVLFSATKLKRTGTGWFRRGYQVEYTKSDLYYFKDNQKIFYYSLYFQLDFDQDDDFVTISFGLPYTYSRLIHQLAKCAEIAEEKEVYWEMKTIEYTLSNNQVPQVIVTAQKEEKSADVQKMMQKAGWKGSTVSKKKVIVIMARQHPCEINSSFLVEQILLALAKRGNYKIAWLLNNFEFRIYPMINVDGVIYGNTRTDLAGFDLNRAWRHPLKELHPQVYTIKRHLLNLQRYNKIAICLDLHSHSKKYNFFTYSFKEEQVFSRLFSYIMSQNCQLFDFPSCRFETSNRKETTARGVLARKIGTVNVVTIQSSYFGVKQEDKVDYFEPKLLQQVGKGVLNSLKSYLRNDKTKKEGLRYLQENISQIIVNEIQAKGDASQSDPEGDNIPLLEKLKLIIPSQAVLKRITTKINQQSQDQEGFEEEVSPFKKYEGYRQSDSIAKTNLKVNPDANDLKLKLKQRGIQNSQSVVQTDLNERDKKSGQDHEVKKKNGSSISIWKKQLKRIKTQPENPIEISLLREEDKTNDLSYIGKNMDDWDDSVFRKEMKRLFYNLTADKREDYLRNYKIKRNSQFMVKNSRVSPNNRLKSIIPRYQRSYQQRKIKVPTLKSLLLSEDHNTGEAVFKIRSEHYSQREAQSQQGYTILKRQMTNSNIIQRNFEEQFKRLKLQYSQRCNGNMSIFTKLIKRQDRSIVRK